MSLRVEEKTERERGMRHPKGGRGREDHVKKFLWSWRGRKSYCSRGGGAGVGGGG